jgi:hypothetical protein
MSVYKDATVVWSTGRGPMGRARDSEAAKAGLECSCRTNATDFAERRCGCDEVMLIMLIHTYRLSESFIRKLG